MAEIKNIIFDLGGVIYDINYQNTIDAFADLGIIDPLQIYSQKGQSKIFDDFEVGALSESEFLTAIKREFPKKVQEEDIIAAWNAMLCGLPDHRIDFLLEIGEEYNIFLLSNTNAIHMQQINDEMRKSDNGDLKSYFHGAYYSFELGMRKPHVETFQEVLKLENLDPEETLFIDDSAQHIKGAKQAGIHVYHHIEEDIVEVIDEVINSL